MEGKCYVPLHPLQPIARCLDIISQVGLHTVLDSSETTRYQNIM
jgi:D-alanine--poly(phosphoribitol) ligase subunit 1